jgi:hypothetical protein
MLAKQADYYFAAVTAAAQFVSSSDEKVKHKAAENFLELYWGPLVMFESPTIVKGMRTMKFCIEHQSSCSDGERQMLSLYLGSALQKDYFNSWRLAPSAFAGRTHDYQHSLDNVADSVWEKIKTEGKESIPPSVSSRSDKKPH